MTQHYTLTSFSSVPDGEVPVHKAGLSGAARGPTAGLQWLCVSRHRETGDRGGAEHAAGGGRPWPCLKPHINQENPLLHPAAHSRHGNTCTHASLTCMLLLRVGCTVFDIFNAL